MYLFPHRTGKIQIYRKKPPQRILRYMGHVCKKKGGRQPSSMEYISISGMPLPQEWFVLRPQYQDRIVLFILLDFRNVFLIFFNIRNALFIFSNIRNVYSSY
jgi:hypothetical protein